MQNSVENAYMIGNLKLLGIAVWLVVVWFFLPERFGGTLATLAGMATVLSVLSLPQVRPHVTRARIFAFWRVDDSLPDRRVPAHPLKQK